MKIKVETEESSRTSLEDFFFHLGSSLGIAQRVRWSLSAGRSVCPESQPDRIKGKRGTALPLTPARHDNHFPLLFVYNRAEVARACPHDPLCGSSFLAPPALAASADNKKHTLGLVFVCVMLGSCHGAATCMINWG